VATASRARYEVVKAEALPGAAVDARMVIASVDPLAGRAPNPVRPLPLGWEFTRHARFPRFLEMLSERAPEGLCHMARGHTRRARKCVS